MLKKIFHFCSSFFAGRMTRQVRELYASTIILNFSLSMINIFEPIFIFSLFYEQVGLKGALENVLFFYLAVYVAYFFAIPLGAAFAKRYGYENSIAVGSIFQICFYFSLFASIRFLPALAVAVVFYLLSKMFYWPAYHGNFSKFSVDGERGREISNLWAIESFVFIIASLIGGAIIEFVGFKLLFVVASCLILASNVPMLITKENLEPQPFSYRDAFRRLFAKANRSRLFGFMGFGEEFIVLVLWPIFMFLTVSDFLGLGVISGASAFIATVVLLFVGHWTDKSDRRILFIYGIVGYAFSWLIRIMARNPLGVLIVDAYSRISKNAVSVPLMADVYQGAPDGGTMSNVVFFEMSLVLGKLLAILLGLLALQMFAPGWNTIFVLGGLFSMLYLFLKIK